MFSCSVLRPPRFQRKGSSAASDVYKGQAVDDKSLSSVDLIHLNFALGKHFEDQETFALAFQYYETGNALKQRETVYDGLLLSDRLQLQHRYCDEALFKRRAKTGHPAADPIFILSLPRSGSTLL